ncbi:MAG: TIGR00730 family Rossman fold protein [Deltaproteobacteria bacterium]|nr:TIGR00730 family Rossman fold protein [Deltaproteobacteria bacterium]
MTRPQELQRIGVFCGSSPGARPAYASAAVALGQALVGRGLGLVYGGGCVGLMGIVADTVLAGGGEVVGVIPRSLARKEVAHEGVSELLVVEDMFERKRIMMERADAFVSLPGGVGTLDELFEVWTWVQLGHLSKPAGLLDVEDFYRGLFRFLDQLVDERFLRSPHRDLLLREEDPELLLDRLSAWSPPGGDKWIDRGSGGPLKPAGAGRSRPG